MRHLRSLAVGFTGALGVAGLLALSALAQAPPKLAPKSPPATAPAKPSAAMSCSGSPPPDSNRAQVQAPAIPEATAIEPSLLKAGIPCAENVSLRGPFGDNELANLQRGFDFYSWLTFIGLNSPASGGSIAAAKPDTPTVWENQENFIQLLDVMLPKGARPDWKTTRIVPPACQSQFKPGMMVINMIEETFNQPFKTGALIDQRGNYALFDILINREMFDYVVKNGLFSHAGQATAENAGLKIDFPSGVNISSTNPTASMGALMLKVSWKILDPDEDRTNFHVVDALVSLPKAHNQTSEPPCLRKALGMVGLHIVHKTKGRPQWIWTSFEHVRNVPEDKDIAAGKLEKAYNFYNPACKPADCPVNATPPRPWDPDPARNLKFHQPYSSQISRVIPLTQETKDMNTQFQKIVGGVWKNYMLISTQWPSDPACTGLQSVNAPMPKTDFEKLPDMTCTPVPTFLANSTLETYSQGSVPLASSNCMACHGNATSYQQLPKNAENKFKLFNQSDFTFILEKAQRDEAQK